MKKLGKYIVNPEAKRFIVLGRILKRRIKILNSKFFNIFLRNCLKSKRRDIALKRVVTKN